jgi:uncharacterized protein (TIGR02996 family)
MTTDDLSRWEMHDGFLGAISESPDEVAHRLIYADWLEEAGEPAWVSRSEFIRIQIERERLRNRSKHRKARLRKQEGEMLAAWADTWLGPWAKLAPFLVYHQGIPERLFAEGQGHFIGQRLGRDADFTDSVQFEENGELQVEFGDRNSAGRWFNALHGVYRLAFTYREVRLSLEVRQVQRQTVRFAGRISSHGNIQLQEQGVGAARAVVLSLRERSRLEE